MSIRTPASTAAARSSRNKPTNPAARMANRHLLRTLIMQSLYEAEFHPKQKLGDIAARGLTQTSYDKTEEQYVADTVAGLTKRRAEIDKLITKHAPEWPLEQIAAIDRCVLRLGIYEVLYSDEVPPKVAINEAVEIAKMFGGENSSSFVNGVLGTIYRASDKYDGKEDEHAKTDKKKSKKSPPKP